MRMRIVLTSQQALELLGALASEHGVALPPEWLSRAYAIAKPLVNIDMSGVPAAVAKPEGWREYLRVCWEWMRGRR